MNTKHVGSEKEFVAFAAAFAAALTPRLSSATVVALSGELGAGKTTFAQGVAKTLGVEEVVASPTFVIEKIYKLTGQKWEHLIHIDAYRLQGAHELQTIGWRELATEPGNLIILEWPERVPECIPESAIRLTFDIVGEGRIITANGEAKSTEGN